MGFLRLSSAQVRAQTTQFLRQTVRERVDGARIVLRFCNVYVVNAGVHAVVSTTRSSKWRGVALLAVAALFFALMTVFAKAAMRAQPGLTGLQVAFFRFFLGFVGIGLFRQFGPRQTVPLRPVSVKWVALRAVFNTAAVIFFFLGIQFTTVTNANMLNMTSPVWIFLLATLYEPARKRPPVFLFYLLLTMTGVYLVVVPDLGQIQQGEAFAAVSGLMAGFAITHLHQARKHDHSLTILFYQFGFGSLVLAGLMWPFFTTGGGLWVWAGVLLSGVFGFLGQHLLTQGYRYIDTRTGSIVSASQLLHATLLGILVFNEPLTWRIGLGGLCILVSLLGVSGIVAHIVKRKQLA